MRECALLFSGMDESSILRRRGLQVGNIKRCGAWVFAASLGVLLLFREDLDVG